VIGAGLSGLAAAACLADAGVHVEVFEAASAPGGLIGTLRTPEGLVERAANAFVWSERTARWFERLGITPQFASDRSRRRFIFRGGRPHRFPLGAGEAASAVVHAASAWVGGRMKPAGRESVAAWGTRVMGPAATRSLLSPALHGIYAAPADRLCAAAVFGARGRRRGRTVSAAPPGGMGEFIERLYERLRGQGVSFTFDRTVDALEPGVPTVVATNAVAAARLVAPHAPALGDAIRAVPMNCMVTATAFFPPRADDLHGFGVLFPRDSHVAALGALFNADVFEGRSRHRLETWMYGADSPDGLPPESDLGAQILRDREKLAGRTDEPISVYATRRAPALPVYSAAILDVRDRLADLPSWLALSGNYLGRIGVSRLLEIGEEAAARLAASGRAA